MIILFVLLLVVGFILFAMGVISTYDSYDKEGPIALISGLLAVALSIILLAYYSNNISKVEALVESGKYEIVTNEDYSLKELEEFLCIGDVYLKEVE